MREIKFRAWDETESIMRFYANIWNNSQPSRHVSTGPNRMGNILNRIHLMQYTRLKDKNGKEIYEGDIVKDNISGISVVEWNCGGFIVFQNVVLCDFADICEVIGNIYENPELLEES